MVPGLAATVKKKLKRAFCEPGNIQDNGLLSFVKHVLFSLFPDGEGFLVTRKPDFGGDTTYATYEELEVAFAKEEVHPGDLKEAVERYINRLLDPIRKTFESPELKDPAKFHLHSTVPSTASTVNDERDAEEKRCGGLEEAYPVPGKAKNASKAPQAEVEDGPHRLDMRVGRVVDVKKHPDADTLYVESIDVGEPTPRTIVSGLANFVPLEEMQNRLVVVLCNLKAAKMRGVESRGMVLCTSNADHTDVEPLCVPATSQPGDRVTVEGFSGQPDEQLNPKKKVWERLQTDLKTNAAGEATWQDNVLTTPAGRVTSRLTCATIK
uniref:Putative tyrosine--trna ligase cytoplasmic n=1 Tax=Lutzomyia longipalpis TaxID=7200 RepID=A0A1B0C8P7_LUTLO